MSHQVQIFQEELEGQKSENLQLYWQLTEYNYEEKSEKSTPITLQGSNRSQGSFSEGGIESILKKQIIIGTETEKVSIVSLGNQIS